MYNPKAKTRYFEGILYPENMPDNWPDVIADILQLPICYALHDQDNLSEFYSEGALFQQERKDHVHVIIVFNNTTTANYAVDVFNRMSLPGKKCCSTAVPVLSIRKSFEYLIHNTEGCEIAGKHRYPASQRHSCNNFDIGIYEQISAEEKKEALRDLTTVIRVYKYVNFADLFEYVLDHDNDEGIYFSVLTSYSGFLERLLKGYYNRYQLAAEAEMKAKQSNTI